MMMKMMGKVKTTGIGLARPRRRFDCRILEVSYIANVEEMKLMCAAALQPSLAFPNRQLPSSYQLSYRMSQLAQGYSLTLAPDASAELGEFLAVGVDAQVADALRALARLTGKDRPGDFSMRVPKGCAKRDESSTGTSSSKRTADLPNPTLESLKSLLSMNPLLHPQASPAVYKLATSLTQAELDYLYGYPSGQPKPLPNGARAESSDLTHGRNPDQASPDKSPVKTLVDRSDPSCFEAVSDALLNSGLLRLDKGGRHSEAAEDGKKGKHNLHWKYEDPALLLKDVLG
jgi:transcriptional coactivator HFI1/ADA1